MLRTMRTGAASGIVKTIVFGLLMAGAIGLAFSGGYTAWTGSSQNTSVASIGRSDIDANQFNTLVRRQLAQQGLDAHTAWQTHYIDQMLNEQIDVKILAHATADLGLNVSDEMVKAQVQKLIAPFVSAGTSAHDALIALLRNQNESQANFIEDIRSQTADTLLRNALQDGTGVVSNEEAADLALFQNERRSLQTVFMQDSVVKGYQEPSDVVLKPLYESGQERYAVPETRSFTLAILADNASDTAAISDADLRKAYEDQKLSFTFPEHRTLDQAILPDEKQAQAVAASVSKGSSLKDAVKSVTGDTKAYTGSQDYQRDGMGKSLGDAAFSALKGTVAGPVKSPLGWHVMVVRSIAPSSLQPFETVKGKLLQEAQSDKSSQGLYDQSTKLDDQLSGGGTLEEAAKTFQLSLVKLGPVHQDGSTPDSRDGLKDYVKDSPKILKTLYSLSEGETSQVIGLSNGRYGAIRLDKIMPKSYKPFDQVKDDLAKVWIADQQNVLNKQKAQDALTKLQTGSMTLEQLADQSDASVKKLDLNRTDKPVAPITASAQEKFFDAALNQYVMQPATGGFIIAKVTAVTLTDPTKIPADQLKTMRQGAMGAMQNEVLQSYLGSLRQQYKVNVHEDTLESMYAKDTGPSGADSGPNDQ